MAGARSLCQILERCGRSNFVELAVGKAPRATEMRLTAIGQMLRDNVCREWHHSEVEPPVYPGDGTVNLRENVQLALRQHSATVPFGITTVQDLGAQSVSVGSLALKLEHTQQKRTTYFVSPTVANQFLYRVQRQRKIWWMRISANPGRYFFSDARPDAERRHHVAVKACFGQEGEAVEVESLELVPGCVLGEEVSDIQVKGKRSSKRSPPTVVHVQQNLEVAVLVVLMDALETEAAEGVRIHRKIAPFKFGIICTAEDHALLEDLRDLAQHLANVLQKAELSVMDCSTEAKPHTQLLTHLGSLGIPYALLLHDTTLRTGLLQLRSRDTTLSETVHISDLPHYLLKVVNY